MRVIKNGAVVSDGWVRVGDDDALPDADVIVSLARLERDLDALLAHPRMLGLAVTGDDDLARVVELLPQLDLVALDFPAAKDGRNYSTARLLRERHGYEGELRAVGDVLRDQLFYMHRCGIDSFALREDQDFEAALAGLTVFSQAYQPATDHDVPVFRFRGAS